MVRSFPLWLLRKGLLKYLWPHFSYLWIASRIEVALDLNGIFTCGCDIKHTGNISRRFAQRGKRNFGILERGFIKEGWGNVAIIDWILSKPLTCPNTLKSNFLVIRTHYAHEIATNLYINYALLYSILQIVYYVLAIYVILRERLIILFTIKFN